MYAAWHSSPDMVKVLLDSGANPKVTDDKGDTACSYVDKNDLAGVDTAKLKALLCKGSEISSSTP
jgi:ankyrin repeat protein